MAFTVSITLLFSIEAIARENKEKKEAEMTKFDKDYERSIETKQEVSQLVKQLGLRRRDILSELSHIFPISCKRSGHDLRYAMH